VDIPIENIYYLLCYAWDKLEERDIVNIDPLESTKLADLLARVLISGADHLVKRGFDRGYVAHYEWTSRLRGRLHFQDSVRRGTLNSVQLSCEFDELSYDVLHNQILKATIRKLIRLDGVAKESAEALARLYRFCYEISDIDLSSRDFGRVQLHRNNSFYDFLLKVCELIHFNLLVSETPGASKFRDFVQDRRQMATLYEEFIRNFYKRHSAFQRVGRQDILWRWKPVDEASRTLLPKMQTDISLTSCNRKIIIDCKFTPEATRRNFDADKLRETHLYQLHAYMSNLPDDPLNENCQMMLLYPEVGSPLIASYTHQGRTITIRTINLKQDWQGVHNDLLRLVE
jgi:5-methylcytosine-specific restriction enzyme subunit McrC